MKKITSFMLMLLCAMTAMAQGVEIKDGLPGTLKTFEGGGHNQYEWKSGKITPQKSDFNAIRIKFMEAKNTDGKSTADKANYPFVAIAEFFLYDKNGEKVALDASAFSSNATETQEGSIAKLADGVLTGNIGKYDWYWHSTWSSTPNDYHTLSIDLRDVEADLSEYYIGWVTRQQNGSPYKVEVEEYVETMVKVKDVSKLRNDKVYSFKSGRGDHYLLYHTDAPNNLSSTYGSGHHMDYSNETTNFQFAVYKFQDKYYMFNVEAQKFVGNNSNENGAIPLVEMPTNDIEFRASKDATHNFVISTSRTGALNCAATAGCHGVVNWNGGYKDFTDTGNVYLITEVGDLSSELSALIEERLNVGVTIAEAEAVVNGASDTRVGAYTKATVTDLASALEAYNTNQSADNFAGVKTALNNVKTNGAKVTLGANEIFTVKCVEDTRGYMVYSTVENMGSEKNVYLAGTNRTEFHAAIDAEGVYKEWAMVVHNGKNYIYNVQKKQFISADGIVLFTDTPAALKLIEIENNLHEIQFESNNRYLSFSPGWGADCVRTEPGIDNGCKFYIDKTGASVDASTSAAVEVTFVNVWKEPILSTFDYVGGYPSSLAETISAVNTLAGITEFENANAASRVQLTPGYYFVKQVSNGKYATYNTDGKFTTETVEKLGIKHVLQFVKDGENIKLNVPNLGKNVKLENADSNGGSASSIVDGGSNFAVEIGNSANIIIKGDGQVMRTEGSGAVNYWWGDTNKTWNIIPATEVEVSINEFASICLPFAVEVENATVYAVEGTNTTHAILTEKDDIPANEGAILAGTGTATLKIITESTSDWSKNRLEGTTIDTMIADEAYVLANGDNGIGMYKAAINDGTWKNNANKAYLPAKPGASGSANLRFDFGGTTAIEEVETEVAETVIYDLTGRRVNEITKAGVYVVNGKKVLVK